MRHVVERPLSEAVFLILSSVAAGPRHGYAILQDVESLSEGRVRLSTGTLYGALRRLLDDGWIRRFKEEDPSRDRQAYELSHTGKQALSAEIDRMKSMAKVAASRLAEA